MAQTQTNVKLGQFLDTIKDKMELLNTSATKSQTNIAGLTQNINTIYTNLDQIKSIYNDVKNSNLNIDADTINIDSLAQKINTVTNLIIGSQAQSGGSNFELLNKLLNNNEFTNLINDTYNNIDNMAIKTEKISNNLDIINSNIDKLNTKISNINISQKDLDIIVNKINEIHNLLVNSNNLFELDLNNNKNNNKNNNNKNDNYTENLTENIFNDNVSNNKIKNDLYVKLKNKQRLLNFIDYINNFNDIDYYPLIKEIIQKLEKFLNSTQNIIKYVDKNKIYDELNKFKENNKLNIISNLEKINNNTNKINNLFNGIQAGGNNDTFFFQKIY